MWKSRIKKCLALGLAFAMLTGVAGCGKEQHLQAEINPDTPASEVQFPLKEKAELSFITSAPATSTQNPNERIIFKRLEKQTNVHIDWTCFVADQFSDKKNLALAQFGNLPDGLFNAGMSDYDLLRYAKQGIIIPKDMKSKYVYPNVFMSIDDTNKVSQYDTDIKKYAEQKKADWILNGGIDKEWDSYLKKMEKYGLSDYLAIKQKYFDQYQESLKEGK